MRNYCFPYLQRRMTQISRSGWTFMHYQSNQELLEAWLKSRYEPRSEKTDLRGF